jgi:hypothetical protein
LLGIDDVHLHIAAVADGDELHRHGYTLLLGQVVPEVFRDRFLVVVGNRDQQRFAAEGRDRLVRCLRVACVGVQEASVTRLKPRIVEHELLARIADERLAMQVEVGIHHESVLAAVGGQRRGDPRRGVRWIRLIDELVMRHRDTRADLGVTKDTVGLRAVAGHVDDALAALRVVDDQLAILDLASADNIGVDAVVAVVVVVAIHAVAAAGAAPGEGGDEAQVLVVRRAEDAAQTAGVGVLSEGLEVIEGLRMEIAVHAEGRFGFVVSYVGVLLNTD